MESELESAGIDPFEFSLMDEDERHEALEDAFLDPWDFEDFDLEYPRGYTYSSSSVPNTPNVPKPPVTEVSPIIKRPAITPHKPENTYSAPSTSRVAADPGYAEEKGNIYSSHKICNVKFSGSDRTYPYLVYSLDLHVGDRVEVPVGATNNSVTATVVSITYSTAPVNQAVIRKLPDYPVSQGPAEPVSEDALRRQRRRAEIAAIDRKMHQLRNMIIVLLSLLVIIVVAGISTANQSPSISVPAYTIEPTTKVVSYSTPTPRPTPKPAATPKQVDPYPYVGMSESSLSSTALGPPSKIEQDVNFEHYRPIVRMKKYIWKKDGYTYFTANTSYWKNDKEVPGYVSSIWKSPQFKEDKKITNPAPYLGMKLSYDDDLYFLGGGGKVNGVSTSKFRYLSGSKYYVVYLDNNYVVQKVENYLPQSSTGKSSSSSTNKKSSSDPYQAKDYAHPDDFYYDYRDDFWDYEDAEDYWERHH